MAELIPVAQAARLREALAEYLGTTFSLADPATRAALEDFLTTAGGGMFRGPYVRLRLPFRPLPTGGATPWSGTRASPPTAIRPAPSRD